MKTDNSFKKFGIERKERGGNIRKECGIEESSNF